MSDLNLRRVGFGSVITRRHKLAQRQVVDKLQRVRWETADQASSLRPGLKTAPRQIFISAPNTGPGHTHRLVVDAIEGSDVTRPTRTLIVTGVDANEHAPLPARARQNTIMAIT